MFTLPHTSNEVRGLLDGFTDAKSLNIEKEIAKG
jgi:hypothetical protein